MSVSKDDAKSALNLLAKYGQEKASQVVNKGKEKLADFRKDADKAEVDAFPEDVAISELWKKLTDYINSPEALIEDGLEVDTGDIATEIREMPATKPFLQPLYDLAAEKGDYRIKLSNFGIQKLLHYYEKIAD